jgi:hypothetical protein
MVAKPCAILDALDIWMAIVWSGCSSPRYQQAVNLSLTSKNAPDIVTRMAWCGAGLDSLSSRTMEVRDGPVYVLFQERTCSALWRDMKRG